MSSQKSRAGRPRMQEPPADATAQDDAASRRTRMRLAQRRYRSKKQDKLAAAEQKATALEAALRGTLNSFRNFQRTILQQPPGTVPLGVAVQLSKTSLEISSQLHSSGVQTQDTLGCNLLDCSNRPCARQMLADQYMKTSVEHNLSPQQNGPPSAFQPELLAGMNLLPGEILIAQTMGQASGNPLGDIDFSGRFVPQLHRKIEGQSETVLRLAPPKLQSLKFGLTRTWFETTIPELKGEWLEATDVEEYLSERGIHVREESAKTVTLHLTADGSDVDSEGPVTPEWEPDLPDWTIFGKKLDERQDVPTGVRVLSSASPAVWSDNSLSPGARAQSKITIDVNKLITGLSKRGVCLGPAPGIRKCDVDEAIREAVQMV